MKLLAIVITYYPDKFAKRNILAYIDHVDKLIIWENTPEKNEEKYQVDLEEYKDKVEVMGDGTNHFIAYPLNRAVEYAIENGYTHLLTMDQDSRFEVGDFAKYRRLVEENIENKSIGIYGVNPNFLFDKSPLYHVSEVITSGSIYDLDIFAKVGNFREDFAIDAVDFEFCYRASQTGFATMMAGSILLNQQFGNSSKEFFNFTTSNYSPFRTYTIIRNTIILWREYPKEFHNKKYGFLRSFVIGRFIKVILAENQKRKKLKAMFWGIVDGLYNRFKVREI